VKRSGRDEPLWVVNHMFMEATLQISLYNYLYLKLAKCCVFLFNKIGEQEGGKGSARKLWGLGVEVAQTTYTHVNEYKNHKRKKEERNQCKSKNKCTNKSIAFRECSQTTVKPN
jgi:hypothetical protein